MTDARYPERWLSDRRILRLSDAAHRLFVLGMVWAASNRSDGELPADDLPLIPSVDPARAPELVAAGLWEQTSSGGYQVVSYGSSQSTAAQLDALDHKRAMDRDRQARHRARAGSVTRDTTRDLPPDALRDGTRDAKARQGQDRTGQDQGDHRNNGYVGSSAYTDEEIATAFYSGGLPKCSRCQHRSDQPLIAGRCRRCAYPTEPPLGEEEDDPWTMR